VDRGYYNHGYDVATIACGGYNDDSTMIHEFGHRCEYTSDNYAYNTKKLADFEREFYQARTAGESVRKLKETNPDYRDEELYRPDKFVNAYMGKEYGLNSRSMEIFTMGVEGVLMNKDQLFENDPEYFDFILGLLAAYE
jgi:hypothetical protein